MISSFRDTATKCLESSGATLEEFKSCREKQLPADEHFKCFTTCILHEHGLLDDHGLLKVFDIGITEIKDALEECSTERKFFPIVDK